MLLGFSIEKGAVRGGDISKAVSCELKGSRISKCRTWLGELVTSLVLTQGSTQGVWGAEALSSRGVVGEGVKIPPQAGGHEAR